MVAGAAAKRLLLIVGLVLVALLVFGLVRGAIGSAILGVDSLVPRPEIHLPPQPIFPASARELHLGLTENGDASAAEPAAPVQPDAPGGHEANGETEAHATPLGVTEFAVTNTMLSAWLASIVLILFLVLGAGKKAWCRGAFRA